MSDVKTFIPSTPVEFSAGLISSLDGSNESSFSRQQKKEQLIQSEITKKLNQLQKDQSGVLDDKLKSLILQKDDSKFNGAPELNSKLDKITQDLKKISDSIPPKSQQLQKAEKSVTECLLANKGQPLNCWEQVETFKKLAADF